MYKMSPIVEYGKSWSSDNTLVIKTTYYEFVYHILKRIMNRLIEGRLNH